MHGLSSGSHAVTVTLFFRDDGSFSPWGWLSRSEIFSQVKGRRKFYRENHLHEGHSPGKKEIYDIGAGGGFQPSCLSLAR